MATTINPGYMGYAMFGSNKIRFTDCNFAAKQEINAPDLITGHWNRQAYNYGPVEISGSISGPMTESFTSAGNLWDLAVGRDPTCGTLTETSLTVYYYCGFSYVFDTVKINSMTFSCASGDVAQFSIDIMGSGAPATGAGGGVYEDIDKLVTWDVVNVNVTAGGSSQSWDSELFQNFEVTYGNNIEPVYAIGQSNLYPYQLVDGITTISGSVSAYNIQSGMHGEEAWGDYAAGSLGSITFNPGSGDKSLTCQWHRVEPTAAVGPIVSTVAFTGLGTQTT